MKVASLALPLAMLPTPAPAAPGVEIELAMVSDYRERGISRSDGGAAVQGSLSAQGPGGSYGFLWGSRVLNGSRDVELQAGVGLVRDFGGGTIDLAAGYTVEPGAPNDDLFELQAVLSHPLGPADVAVRLIYAPPQRGTGGPDNLHAAVEGRVPLGRSRLALCGSAGIETGAFGRGKRDWSIGADYELGGAALNLSWVGSGRARAGRLGRNGLVLSVARGF